MDSTNEPNAAPVDAVVHTPGPWIYDSGAFYAECQLDEDGMTYEAPIAALLEGRPFDTEGNARLIAAAPAMLEEVGNAINVLDPEMSRREIVELRERLIRFRSSIRGV